jgi:hypothetical protein
MNISYFISFQPGESFDVEAKRCWVECRGGGTVSCKKGGEEGEEKEEKEKEDEKKKKIENRKKQKYKFHLF